MSNQNLKKPQLCETGTCFDLKIPGLNQKQHFVHSDVFQPNSIFFKLFYGCSFEQCTGTVYVSPFMYQKWQSIKKKIFPVLVSLQ